MYQSDKNNNFGYTGGDKSSVSRMCVTYRIYRSKFRRTTASSYLPVLNVQNTKKKKTVRKACENKFSTRNQIDIP